MTHVEILQSVNVNEEVDGRPLILYAADYGQADVIEYLISAGADVNVSTYFTDCLLALIACPKVLFLIGFL